MRPPSTGWSIGGEGSASRVLWGNSGGLLIIPEGSRSQPSTPIGVALDFPAGVYNVVTGFGAEAGKALSEHPRIGSITFTGSVETGRAVIRASAEHVKPVVLELGGKSPQIVFADSSLERVA